ncbi:MAG TPA: class I SAM-dependent methyltransferase [candidate division Zixibacteria bacterium]|nr:class I SAM-dependent methyltransferase [candidate division Zixibacteria bacterium]
MAKVTKNIEHYFVANPRSKPRYGLIRTYLRRKPFEFLTASGVFSKQRVDLGTRLLIESMLLPKKGCALDIGCGYGAVGIGAAAFNPHLYVILVDLNARAVWLARQNVEKNLVSNAEVRRGYLYEPVEDLIFDCILSNPPVSAGMETVKAMIAEAPRHMARGGVFQMVVKSKIGGKRLRTIFEEAFGSVEVLARESGYRVLFSRKQ